MIIEEFRNKVLEAKDPEWFNNVSCTFSSPRIGLNISFKGITAIFEYVSQQYAGWDGITEKLPPEFEQSKNKFRQFKEGLISFLQGNVSGQSQSLATNWSNQIALQFINIAIPYIPYDIQSVTFLINLYNSYPNYFKGAFDAIIGNSNLKNYINDSNYLFGIIMAYEFQTKESSEIVSRKNIEAAELI